MIKKILSIKSNDLTRHKWVQDQLEKLPRDLLLLDAGCGPQNYRKYCSHLKYKGQDFGQYDGVGNGEGLQDSKWQYGKLDYVGNIWAIDEKDETFDVILCTEVLEHIPYPEQTLQEFSRLLKKDGTLLLTAPFLSIPHMEPFYYYSGFSKNFYSYFTNKYGMEIVSMEANGNAYDFIAQELIRSAQFVPNKILKFLFKIFIYGLAVPILKFFSKKDRLTGKYMCFGYHIIMKKSTQPIRTNKAT